MIYVDEDLYWELDKKKRDEIKLENLKERIEEKRKLNRSYLKGQRGVRLYYDETKLYEDDYAERLERRVKCVYTRDLRIEKLFGYLKYMNGRRVLLRDIAWHFAVTKRTIQSDLKWLESNGFITTQKNKTTNGKQTKNSYIVHTEKAKYLPCENTFLNVIILSKQNNEFYVLTKTNYLPKDKAKKFVPIYDCNFTLPKTTLNIENKINDRSMILANNIFDEDVSKDYKGYVYTAVHKIQKEVFDIRTFEEYTKDFKAKTMFSLFMLSENFSAPSGYMWLKLEQANRYIKHTYINKALNDVRENQLG